MSRRCAAGTPLTDEDRWPWLEKVADWIRDHTNAGLPGIITCSALKRIYRDVLRGDNVVFVHLAGNKDTIARRLNARLDHYMPSTLLDSQISTLEPPGPDENTLVVEPRSATGRGGGRDHRAAGAHRGERFVRTGTRLPRRVHRPAAVGPVEAGGSTGRATGAAVACTPRSARQLGGSSSPAASAASASSFVVCTVPGA